jgi:hypothetical protein
MKHQWEKQTRSPDYLSSQDCCSCEVDTAPLTFSFAFLACFSSFSFALEASHLSIVLFVQSWCSFLRLAVVLSIRANVSRSRWRSSGLESSTALTPSLILVELLETKSFRR